MKIEFCENSFILCMADTETLGRWDDSVVLSAGFVFGDIRQPKTFQQLVDEALFMKFKVSEQMSLGRKTQQNVLDWWKSDKVSDLARQTSLYPNELIDESVVDLPKRFNIWAHKLGFEPKSCTMMDRNLFDYTKLQHIIECSLDLHGFEPWHYHNILDCTSVLRAWGTGRYGGIDIRTLEGVCYHHPVHDAAVDWLRIQSAALESGIITLQEQPQ